MKKLMAILLLVTMLFTAALAETATETETETATETEADTTWYELSEDAGALVVHLAANATTGYAWTYTISDETMLELVTDEYTEDEHEDGMTGVGGTWNASFMAIGDKSGEVDLTLTYARSFEPDTPAREIVMHLAIDEAGALTVVSTEEVPMTEATEG